MDLHVSPYDLLDLPHNFTEEQLRRHYKRVALQVHPDRRGGSDRMFKLVHAAYQRLAAKLEQRKLDKPFYELRKSSRSPQSGGGAEDRHEDRHEDRRFDSGRFNRMFEEHRFQDADDHTNDGYGDWMAPSSTHREDIDVKNVLGKFSAQRFNELFERQPATVERGGGHAVSVYREPAATTAAKQLPFSELGLTRIDDFGGANAGRTSLHFSDYKLAHTTTRLVDQKMIRDENARRKVYGNVQELQRDRESASFDTTAEDAERYARELRRAERNERKRMRALASRDERIGSHFEKVSVRFLGR